VPSQDYIADGELAQYHCQRKSDQMPLSGEHNSCQGAQLGDGNVVSDWKYCAQYRFHTMAQEALSVVALVLSPQIDQAKSINSPNQGQHKLLRSDLVLDF
jgi:hypothetical protein